MTTQGTAYTESDVSTARRSSIEGHAATDGNEATIPELKAKLRHMMDAGKARATDWRDGLQDGIRERPIQSLIIAAAVGAVVGLVVGRRTG